VAETPRTVHLQIVAPSAEPPAGDGWLHEVKRDGQRLVAIVAGDNLKLISRNGHDRTALFREPFENSSPQTCRHWCSIARSRCRTSAA
jgi:bifunctional non-homologous end joining protein LigD